MNATGCRLRALGSRSAQAAGRRAVSALVAGALLLTGCASSAGDLEQAVKDYDQGRYEQAEQHAGAVMRRSVGGPRARAAYVAGLSAYRLSRPDDAERYVLDAARGQDPDTAARAEAMLGLIRLDQQRPQDAVRHFDRAASGLSGGDAAQAAAHARYAHDRAGGAPGGQDAAAWTPSPDQVAAGGGRRFTIQAGAFRQAGRARRTADEISPLVGQEGFGPVEIVEQPDGRGRTMYHVQFGRFGDRREAADARRRLGRLDFIVAPLSATF